MNDPTYIFIDEEQAKRIQVQVSSVFQPRTPIATRELFAGRWSQITTLADAVGQPGLHVVIYGERGVGKTSLANVVKPVIEVFDEDLRSEGLANPPLHRLIVKTNASTSDTFSTIWLKVLNEITWRDNRPILGVVPGDRKAQTLPKAFGLADVVTVDDVRKTLSILPGSVFIIDEFDRVAQKTAQDFTDLLKALSDFSIDCTVILVGVSDTIDELIKDHASITRAISQIPLPRMEVKDLRQILSTAEKKLGIKFSNEASDLIVHISQGLPHYTHLLGLYSTRIAAKRMSGYIERDDVIGALKDAVGQAQQSVTQKYSAAIHSAHKDALYRHVLLACALAAANAQDPLGYFNPGSVVEPLGKVLGREVQIATFSNHLSEFCDEKREQILERTGQERAYRFRFRDPLLVPFIFMEALTKGLITGKNLAQFIGGKF